MNVFSKIFINLHHLISSHLISSHLISSHLISSHLISSHLISSHILDANVQSDVKIDLTGGADKPPASPACKRSGTCSNDPSKATTANAIQTLQQLLNQAKSSQQQNSVTKDSATVLVNGVPVKIPLGK